MSALGDGAMRHLRDAIDRPDALPRYEVHELLGRGGMGAVYRAHDTVLDRDVALKVLTLEGEHEGSVISARLARESRVLAQLEHPGIVAVHDAGELPDGRPFYVMRLVRGTSLTAHFQQRTATLAHETSLGARLRLFLRVCEAVAFAHARGVIHRDLKPSNIMVGEFGEVLVLDWGVAKLREEGAGNLTSPDARTVGDDGRVAPGVPSRADVTQDGAVVGTPGYMAPELAAGGARDADARTDVFALGAILRDLIRMEAGTPPAPLRAIVEHATASMPNRRYADVTSIADDVRRWLDGDRVSSHRENLFERAARQYRRNQTLVLLFLAYLVVRLIILFWRRV